MRKEFQVKVLGTIGLSLLLGLGAEPLGQVTQKDIYLVSEKTWRIREEAGQFLFTQKSHDIGQKARVKDVEERLITQTEANRLLKEKGVKVQVCKSRTLYRLNNSVVAVDRVEHLGDFVEISSAGEKELFQALRSLGFSTSEVVKESYLDMMVQKALPRWLQAVLLFHEKVGELTFGITSGILTTVGVLVGVNAATASKLSVIAAIVAIAVADSLSDAFGMYMSKVSERGGGRKVAFRYAMGTLAGKFFFPLTFIIPIAFSPLETAVWINLSWGGLVLILLSVEQALVAQESVLRQIARNVGLVIFIIAVSTLAGRWIGSHF